ncbi:NAD(P)-dependent oxidoreductase [uncultured Tateyamaria sp.]|uniref:NAD(P)-dependent oxidoreductase n=1 Tax=uncultured Tateyamaria sp. TaxID=455651 RepID=UPI002606EEE1|nr:NAD(P)-dependent oxidoreductase [uncultured Tateyamaria sp.]
MARVLVAGKLHDSGLALLQARSDFEIDYIEEISEASMEPYLADATAVLLRTQPFEAAAIAKSRKLAMVSRHGVGFDAVDVGALNSRGIPLAIVGDVNAQTVAEHAMLLLLSASRRLISYDGATRPGGDWGFRNSLSAREVSGKTLLIIGLGRIGRHLSRMARGFDIEVIAYDPYMSQAAPLGVSVVDDLDTALATADLVSVHVPRTDQPLIGRRELGLMKSTAVIVNTARGGSIEEAALADALSEGRIFGAGLDVFVDEPPTIANRLTTCATATLTPHSASMTAECAERMAVVSAQNILDFFDGHLDPELVVNAHEIRFSA